VRFGGLVKNCGAAWMTNDPAPPNLNAKILNLKGLCKILSRKINFHKLLSNYSSPKLMQRRLNKNERQQKRARKTAHEEKDGAIS
jgi:hypothetical protein